MCNLDWRLPMRDQTFRYSHNYIYVNWRDNKSPYPNISLSLSLYIGWAYTRLLQWISLGIGYICKDTSRRLQSGTNSITSPFHSRSMSVLLMSLIINSEHIPVRSNREKEYYRASFITKPKPSRITGCRFYLNNMDHAHLKITSDRSPTILTDCR